MILYDLEAEEALVASAIEDPNIIGEMLDLVPPRMIYDTGIRAIYDHISDMYDRGEAINHVTLPDSMRRDGKETQTVFRVLADNASTIHDPSANAKIVRDYYERRGIVEAATQMLRDASDLTASTIEIREAAESHVFALRTHGSISGVRPTEEVLSSILEGLEEAQRRAALGKVLGVTSGVPDIDNITLGWQGSKVYTLAARPGVGKTALAIGFAFDSLVPTLVFSMEMDAEELVERRLMPEAGVNAYKAKRGNLKQEDWDALTEKSGELSRVPLWVDDRPGLSVHEVRSVARKMKAKHDIGLVIVDYLQLAHGVGLGKSANREQEVAQISRGMKEMSKELKVPVIALSQLNRIRATERPGLENLRESGAIEQDSDVVMFLWRDDDLPNGDPSRVVNWAIEKHRGGTRGGGQLVYQPQTARLVPYHEDEQKAIYVVQQ